MFTEAPLTTQEILDIHYSKEHQSVLSQMAESELSTARKGIAVNFPNGLLGDCQLTYLGRNQYQMDYGFMGCTVVGTKQTIKLEIIAAYEVCVH